MNERIITRLGEIRCFALDLDGTLYLGDSLFPFTPQFLQTVKKTGRDFLCVTNNASRGLQDYMQKFVRLGLKIPENTLYSSADATIDYFQQTNVRKLFVLGTTSLKGFLADRGRLLALSLTTRLGPVIIPMPTARPRSGRVRGCAF